METQLKKMTFWQKLVILVYGIGIACVITFLLEAIIGGDKIFNEDAMLPFSYFERNMIVLAIGCIPMFISSLLMIYIFGIQKKLYRVVVLIPAIITAIPFVIMVVLICILLVLGVRDSIMYQLGIS